MAAKSALESASTQARDLQRQITEGNTKAATVTLADLQRSTDTARTNTDGFLWDGLGLLPVIGDSVDATQTISTSLDDIAQRGLPPVVKVSSSLDADLFKPKDGRFDLVGLQELAPSVTTASEVLTENRRAILDIDAADLVGPLQKPLGDLKEKIGSAQFAASSAAKAMQLAPTMLGIDGKRRYLLLFQNNAEVRSTGGLPGAFAVVTAKNGKLTIGQQGSAADIKRYEEKQLVKLTDDEAAVYGKLMTKDFRNINFTPHFPRTAQIAREMIDDSLDIEVDGVLSIDPVALGYLLKGTGPIKGADDTELTSDNAVDVLLNDVYARYEDPRAQDEFFADSAQRIFDAVTDGTGDSRTVLEQLVQASEEHRVLLWSADKDEQSQLAPTRLSGEFSGEDAEAPQVGVFMNDSTASKMQYYLDTSSKVESVRCTDDGMQTLKVTSTFVSTAPADASELPGYITGDGHKGPEGTMLLDTRYFGPAGGRFVSFSLNGKPRPNNNVSFGGRPANFAAFALKPGQKVTVTATMVTANDQRADAVFSTTPGARPTANGVAVPTSCN
jgi:hypothetical protein